MPLSAGVGRAVLGLLAILACFFCAAPASAQNENGRWLRAESTHFVIYSDAREGDVREAARTLEMFDATLRHLIPPGRESSTKLEVYLFRNRASLRAIRPGLSDTVLGFYSSLPEKVAAFAVFRDSGGLEAQEILFHEYAHHFMMHYFTQAYPAWFAEGFAEVVQTIEFDDDNSALVGRYSNNRAAWIVAGDWLPTEQLLRMGRTRLSRSQTAQFYAQSWLTAHYFMLNAEHQDRFRAYLAAFQRGEDPIDSFEPTLQMTPREFNALIRRYARSNLPLYRVRFPATTGAAVQISRLPQAANDLLLLEVRMRFVSPAMTTSAA